MKKFFRKSTAVILSFALLFSVIGSATGVFAQDEAHECDGNCEFSPSIIVPGLFQCESFMYDEKGNLAVNSDGDVREAPFFLDSTGDIVKEALATAGLPLFTTLMFQHDFGGRFATALGDALGKILLGRVVSDANGKMINDIRATKYNGSFATLNEHDQQFILDCIPLAGYLDVAPADHLYFFSYYSFGNILDLADELYALIQQVKEETGHDKVNIVPISQGGSLANALLECHPKVYNDLDRIVYIIPALDGSDLIGDIFTEGLIDDDEALYRDMFSSLFEDDDAWTGYLLNLAIRIFPKDVLNNALDVAVDTLIEDYLEYSTCIWALCPSGAYPKARDKYLSDPEDKEIRRQTDIYYQAQLDSDENILAAIDAGVKVFDIVDYNYPLYAIVDSYSEVNADGIIQLDSTSMGAVSYGVDVELPDDYVACTDNCTDPENHNHIDPYNIVDAGAGLLPETTFYFYGQNHEQTARNDIIMKLTIALLTDNNFTSIYSYPDKFPQFNGARSTRGLINDLKQMKSYDLSGVSEEDKAELAAAIQQCEAALDDTVANEEKYDAATSRFYTIRAKVLGVEEPSGFDKFKADAEEKGMEFLTDVLRKMSDATYKYWGPKGYSDWFKR